MKSIFDDQTLSKFKKIREICLKVFVGILIAEVVLWAIIILAQQSNEIVRNFQSTFLTLAVALFVLILDFRCIEKGRRLAQILALVSLATFGIWVVMQLLMTWGAFEMYDDKGFFGIGTRLSIFGKIGSVISCAMYASMFGALVSKIEENGGPIKPLKITALICMAYIWAFMTIVSINGDLTHDYGPAVSLCGLAVLAFIVLWIAAAVISRSNRKDKIDHAVNASQNVKNEAKTQDEIKALVEKEVQERLAEERAKMESEKSSEE